MSYEVAEKNGKSKITELGGFAKEFEGKTKCEDASIVDHIQIRDDAAGGVRVCIDEG